jgi:hypothetical protein
MSPVTRTEPLRAELLGSSTARCGGQAATGRSPVLGLCRRLVAAGHDPSLPLHVYRGATLVLTVRTIGEGAALTVREPEVGAAHFAAWRPFPSAPVAPCTRLRPTPAQTPSRRNNAS